MDTVQHKQDPVDPLDREFAKAWIPDPGDALKVFLVTAVDERPDMFNESGKVPVITGLTGPGTTEGGEPIAEESERALHAIHANLRGKLADLKVDTGDVIGVKFLGWHRKGEKPDGLGPREIPKGVKPRDGSYRYRVVSYRNDEASFDWSRYSTDTGAEPDASGTPADTSGLAAETDIGAKLHRPAEEGDDDTPF